jgi:predicted dehydrogenase
MKILFDKGAFMVYKVGIIGCGRKGATIDDERRWMTNYDEFPCCHASAFGTVLRPFPTNTHIVAACDPSPEKLQDFQRRWGECKTYTNYCTMLEQEKLDVVSIATHAPLHAPMTMDAAQAGGKGILCEKAMATSLEECDAMMAACAARGVKLLVNHPRRFHPTFIRAKQQIEQGAIGQLRSIYAAGYNKLIHNGSHAFDILRFFCGEAAWAQGELIEVDDPQDKDGVGTIKMANGVTAFVDFASQQPFGFRLMGSEGVLIIDQFRDGFTLINFEPEEVDPAKPWFRYTSKRSVERYFPNRRPFDPPMQSAVKELIAAIEENREPQSNGVDGRAALEIGLAMHASHQQGGARVTLPMEDRTLQVLSR